MLVRMTRARKIVFVLSGIAILLLAARVALPSVVKRVVNRQLMALGAYDGHVGDVDIHLWRGAYSLDDIEIVKTGASRPVPFFRAQRIDLSIEWKSLWRGSLVSEAAFRGPEVNLVRGKSEADSQLGKEENWNARLEELFPFRFNTVTVSDGTVRFLAPGIRTQDAITANHVTGAVTNLTNVLDAGKRTFADFNIEADVLHGAPARINGSVDAFAAQPTFDVNMEVKEVSLPEVNPWLRQYIQADAEAGKFELYLELAAADGKFAGYAKPILEDVDLYRSGEPEENPLKRVWEGFLDFAANVLENREADQIAARIPFSGTLKDPDTSLFATIASVLHNAFVSAFARSLEGSITLRDVRKNLRALDPNEDSSNKDEPNEGASDQDNRERAKDGVARPKPGPAGKS